MRISTQVMFEQSMTSMNRQQSEYLKIGQQIASGKKVVRPSDDPQAASRAVGVAQAKAQTQQYADARISARNALSQEESVLNSVTQGISSAKNLLVQAASETLSDADRQSIGGELRGIYESLLGQANVTDGNGRYLFGGYKDDAPPFAKSGEGSAVVYNGDERSREQQVDASRRMPVSDNGKTIFQSVASGNGHLAIANENQGNVTFKGPSRLDSNQPGYGENAYVLKFTGTDTFTMETLNAEGNAISSVAGQTFEAGVPIEIGNGAISITLEGSAADGDEIAIRPADHGQANQNLFKTLETAIKALETPIEGKTNVQANFRNAVSTSMRELDNSLDNVLTVRASVGARLNELDVVDTVGSNRMLNYEQTLSDLVDLDYSKAISEYSMSQVGLQASQKAFMGLKNMSLFDML
ncbi:flagellar hook-associated protein 3 [Pistricoccus aurantiacus]|uniref:Flagellar hook-associated protein 3 n=1 Tax=Pistricoccus aurantiacus TaxID=1883414 RepID=A0A5B8STL4_9GAMM|nr:flagellar hook-associated protein FlgL [Pistricoccus aurantiacus]QEA39694.1 flagellar hook-associated protein 3 [Pistricoccus aurantiacus]